jgi:hypothetical protein
MGTGSADSNTEDRRILQGCSCPYCLLLFFGASVKIHPIGHIGGFLPLAPKRLKNVWAGKDCYIGPSICIANCDSCPFYICDSHTNTRLQSCQMVCRMVCHMVSYGVVNIAHFCQIHSRTISVLSVVVKYGRQLMLE